MRSLRPVTILHVIDALDVGGAQELLILLARHAAPEYRSVVCSLQQGQGVRSRLEAAGAEVYVLGRPRPSITNPHRFLAYMLQGLRDIVRLCARVHPDVIHCHLSDAVLLGGMASFFTGIPKVIITKHTPLMFPDRGRLSPRNLLRKAVLRFFFRHARTVVAVSRQTERALRQAFALSPDRVRYIPNGVEIRASKEGPEVHALRLRLGLARDDIAVLNVGRLVPVKGQIYLIEAIALLSDRSPNMKLFIAGDGESREGLTKCIDELGLADRVHLLGDRQDVADLLTAADIVAFSSLSEGTSLAVMEAMAAGKPIAATAIRGNMDVLTHRENALLVPAGDPRSMADALSLLATDRRLADQLGAAARNKARAECDIKQVVKAYAAIWRQ